MKAIIPKGLNIEQIARAVENTLNAAAIAVQIDFETTTATWDTQVDFATDTPSPDRRIVGTDNLIYHWVNGGTKAHDISPKNGKILRFQGGYTAKTRPSYIGSGSGGRSGGVITTRKTVKHPGTKARAFDVAIAEKWEKQLAIQMQAAINAELR